MLRRRLRANWLELASGQGRKVLRRSAKPVQATMDAARQAGRAQPVSWVEQGALIASGKLAAKRGMTPQLLQKAAAHGPSQR